MATSADKNWLYKVVGRNIYLWQYIYSGNTSVLGGYAIKLPGNYYGNQLIYPDVNIANGLRFEGTAFINTFVNNDPNILDNSDNPTLTSDTGTEASHVNVSYMLSLAITDYLQAQMADKNGEIDKKEYYMRSFWKKVSDNESNKRKAAFSIPSSPYAIK